MLPYSQTFTQVLALSNPTTCLKTQCKTLSSWSSFSYFCNFHPSFSPKSALQSIPSLRANTLSRSNDHGLLTICSTLLYGRRTSAGSALHPHPMHHLHAPRAIHPPPGRETSSTALQTTRFCFRTRPVLRHSDGLRLRGRQHLGCSRSPFASHQLRKRGCYFDDREKCNHEELLAGSIGCRCPCLHEHAR